MFKLMSWRWNLINFAALLDWSCETANYSDFTEKQQILNQIWRIANAFHCQVFHCFEFHSFNVKIWEQKVRFAECYISSPCSIQIGENDNFYQKSKILDALKTEIRAKLANCTLLCCIYTLNAAKTPWLSSLSIMVDTWKGDQKVSEKEVKIKMVTSKLLVNEEFGNFRSQSTG